MAHAPNASFHNHRNTIAVVHDPDKTLVPEAQTIRAAPGPLTAKAISVTRRRNRTPLDTARAGGQVSNAAWRSLGGRLEMSPADIRKYRELTDRHHLLDRERKMDRLDARQRADVMLQEKHLWLLKSRPALLRDIAVTEEKIGEILGAKCDSSSIIDRIAELVDIQNDAYARAAEHTVDALQSDSGHEFNEDIIAADILKQKKDPASPFAVIARTVQELGEIQDQLNLDDAYFKELVDLVKTLYTLDGRMDEIDEINPEPDIVEALTECIRETEGQIATHDRKDDAFLRRLDYQKQQLQGQLQFEEKEHGIKTARKIDQLCRDIAADLGMDESAYRTCVALADKETKGTEFPPFEQHPLLLEREQAFEKLGATDGRRIIVKHCENALRELIQDSGGGEFNEYSIDDNMTEMISLISHCLGMPTIDYQKLVIESVKLDEKDENKPRDLMFSDSNTAALKKFNDRIKNKEDLIPAIRNAPDAFATAATLSSMSMPRQVGGLSVVSEGLKVRGSSAGSNHVNDPAAGASLLSLAASNRLRNRHRAAQADSTDNLAPLQAESEAQHDDLSDASDDEQSVTSLVAGAPSIRVSTNSHGGAPDTASQPGGGELIPGYVFIQDNRSNGNSWPRPDPNDLKRAGNNGTLQDYIPPRTSSKGKSTLPKSSPPTPDGSARVRKWLEERGEISDNSFSRGDSNSFLHGLDDRRQRNANYSRTDSRAGNSIRSNSDVNSSVYSYRPVSVLPEKRSSNPFSRIREYGKTVASRLKKLHIGFLQANGSATWSDSYETASVDTYESVPVPPPKGSSNPFSGISKFSKEIASLGRRPKIGFSVSQADRNAARQTRGFQPLENSVAGSRAGSATWSDSYETASVDTYESVSAPPPKGSSNPFFRDGKKIASIFKKMHTDSPALPSDGNATRKTGGPARKRTRF